MLLSLGVDWNKKIKKVMTIGGQKQTIEGYSPKRVKKCDLIEMKSNQQNVMQCASEWKRMKNRRDVPYRKVYWLLDSRFDFLLPSFMREFKVKKENIILVNSYHSKSREKWNKIYVPYEIKNTVVLMEPDDINRVFSEYLQLDQPGFLIAFSGAGLPISDRLVSLTATGAVADKCNDKWWQYCCFADNRILTPYTYQYCGLEALQAGIDRLLYKYSRVVVKKPCLSGGYQMKVLSSGNDLESYKERLKNREPDQIFLVSEYISHRQSFAGMGIVRRDRSVFFINTITEQVLYREVAYEGLIYPAFLNDNYKDEIRNMTEKIGKVLGQSGYFGFYNVDYILGDDNRMYAIEINARLGFSTILVACLYGDKFWKLLRGDCMSGAEYQGKRLVLGKIKAKEGRSYSNLKSYSNIMHWFQAQNGFFKTYFCGTDEPENFEYGSYIGVFGEFFDETDTKEKILNYFWEKCLEQYE